MRTRSPGFSAEGPGIRADGECSLIVPVADAGMKHLSRDTEVFLQAPRRRGIA